MRYTWLLICAVMIGSTVGFAQQSDKQPPAKDDLSDIDRLLLALEDINWLNNVIPLHLTPEQMDKLAAANKKAQDRLQALMQDEAKELRSRRDEIMRVRQDSMKGKSVPKEFIDRMKKLEDEARKRRKELRNQVLGNLSSELKPIFTDEQFKYMVERSKEILKSAGLTLATSSDDAFYAIFIENVFLTDRAPELLKEFKANLK